MIKVGDIGLWKKVDISESQNKFFTRRGEDFPSQSEVGAEQWRPTHCGRPAFAALQRKLSTTVVSRPAFNRLTIKWQMDVAKICSIFIGIGEFLSITFATSVLVLLNPIKPHSSSLSPLFSRNARASLGSSLDAKVCNVGSLFIDN